MNIFNWGQDNNIIWIENIEWWILNHFSMKIRRFILGDNRLSDERAENICRKMFNHIGIITPMDELGRLIGFGNDLEDYYYIIKERNGKIVWHSMVMDFCSLRGKISNWAYHNIDTSMEINNCPKEKEFLIEIDKRSFSQQLLDFYNSKDDKMWK